MPSYTNEQMAEALKKSRGMVYVAARQLGCSPNTIKARLAKSKKLAEIKEAEEGVFLDTAEIKLMQSVQDGELPAIKFVLSTKGKERGYTERSEVTGKDGGPVVHRLVVVDSSATE